VLILGEFKLPFGLDSAVYAIPLSLVVYLVVGWFETRRYSPSRSISG
jgi:hypothetical protein